MAIYPCFRLHCNVITIICLSQVLTCPWEQRNYGRRDDAFQPERSLHIDSIRTKSPIARLRPRQDACNIFHRRSKEYHRASSILRPKMRWSLEFGFSCPLESTTRTREWALKEPNVSFADNLEDGRRGDPPDIVTCNKSIIYATQNSIPRGPSV